VRFADNIRDTSAALDELTPRLQTHADALDRAAASQLALGQATADSLDMVTPKVAALGDTAAAAADQTAGGAPGGAAGVGPTGQPPANGGQAGYWYRDPATGQVRWVSTYGVGAQPIGGGGGAAPGGGAPASGGGVNPTGLPPPNQGQAGYWYRDPQTGLERWISTYGVGAQSIGGGAAGGGGAGRGAGAPGGGGVNPTGLPPPNKGEAGYWWRDPQTGQERWVSTYGVGAAGIGGGAGGGGAGGSVNPTGQPPANQGQAGYWYRDPQTGQTRWVSTYGVNAPEIGGGSGGGGRSAGPPAPGGGSASAAHKKDASSGPTQGERQIVGAVQALHETTKSLLATAKSGPAVSWDTTARAMGLAR